MISQLLPATAAAPARRLWLPFLLPSFNDLENARGLWREVRPGVRVNSYAALKKETQNTCVAFFNGKGPQLTRPVVIAIRWWEQNLKRDRDGIASGGRKIIHDALARGRGGARGWAGAGIIHCDGAHCVAGQVDVFTVGKPSGVEVLLYEVAS
jgi:hypothetical protein